MNASESKVMYCSSCGAALNVELNRGVVVCHFCHAKNVIESQQMKTNIQSGNMNFSANTDIDQIIKSAEYAISVSDYKKAHELLMTAIISGTSDYRIYINKAKIDLLEDDNKGLFESLEALNEMELFEQDFEVKQRITYAINKLMGVRGKNGVIALHNATFHERLDLVKFCVEHGADVNCVAGMNQVTPVTIMYVPVSSDLCKIDGTPFVRNDHAVKEIYNYLVAHGAKKSKKVKLHRSSASVGAANISIPVYCLLAVFLGGLGAHKFYSGEVRTGFVYLLFCWTGIPSLLGLLDAALTLYRYFFC